MDFSRVLDQFTRLLLIAIVLHIYRDWGWLAGAAVVWAAFCFALFSEWCRARDLSHGKRTASE